jgi:hypothetical protein
MRKPILLTNQKIKMKSLHKITLLLSFIFLLEACSSTPKSIFVYNQQTPTKVDQRSKYRVIALDVKISKDPKSLEVLWNGNVPSFLKKDFSKYPDEKKLSEIMKTIFQQKLKERDLYSEDVKSPNVFDVEIKFDYKRRGTLLKNAYAVFVMSHEIVISKNGKEVAKSIASDYTRGGYIGDAIVGQRIMFMYGGPKEEINDLNEVFVWITRELQKSAKIQKSEI